MTPEPLLPALSPPVLVTLFTGLLIAFAVQLLMTTFGVAAGITALGFLPGAQGEAEEAEEAEGAGKAEEEGEAETPIVNSGSTAGKIGFAIGAGTLLTVNAVLFAACFLAVKLSVVGSVTLGAVLGVVIWSGYFLALAWLSSKAAGSVLGVLAGAVNAGVQGLMSTVMRALGRNKGRSQATDAALPEAVYKRLASTEANLSILQGQLDTNQRSLEATLQDYVQTLQPPKPDLQSIRQEVVTVLAGVGLPTVAKAGAKTGLSHIDRQAFVELVSSRTDFSKRDVTEVVDQLEGVWQEVVGTPDPITDLTTFFQTASPEKLTSETVNDRLRQLLANAQLQETPGAFTAQSIAAPLEPKPLIKQLVRTVRDRVDLSDLDVGSLLQQLQSLIPASNGADASDDDRADPFTTAIKADVEDYLLSAYPWNLTSKTVQAAFTDVLYDPEANPAAVKHQLLAFDRNLFLALLEQRDDLPSGKVPKIADRLETVRQDVLKTVETAIAEAPDRAFRQQLAESLRAMPKDALQADGFQQQLQSHLDTVNVEQWGDRLHGLTRDSLAALLSDRPDLADKDVEALATQFETVRDRLLTDLQQQETDAKADAAMLWQQLGAYVSEADQKLTARTLQRQLKTLTKAAKTELTSLSKYLPAFDRPTAEQWLSDRSDLTEKQRQRVLSQLEKAWNSLCHHSNGHHSNGHDSNGHNFNKHNSKVPAEQPQDRSVATILTDYVQHLDPATFSVTDLPQDLLHYLKQQHVRDDLLSRLTLSDWKPLLEQVQQRQDLTAEQREQLQQALQRSLYTLGKLPRRLALRSQRQVQHWQDVLSDYLRHAERDDLSPDRLPQLLQALLGNPTTSDASHWLETLQELPFLNREQLVALLSERGDMTATDIHQIVERVEATLQQAIAHAQTLQRQVQESLTTAFDKLRHYITSLPLPELDYDRLKNDLQQMFVDPRVGLESLNSSLGETLRDQLSTLNRDSLTALISTRDDLSTVFTEQVIDRIDTVRLAALDQIETIQQGTQRQLEALKQQAQQQAEDTRKAVATAAWWLFLTAFSSALTSAIAGALAVGGLQWFEQWLVR